MKKFQGTKSIILIVIMVLLVVSYYGYLTNRGNRGIADEVPVSKVQDVLLRDLEKNYPPSPKEVVKYYSEITECFYNEEYTDEEFSRLAQKARALYDEELIGKNPEEDNLLSLKKEIDQYKKDKQVISSYSVSPSTDVQYWMDNQMASLYCVYVLRAGKTAKSVNEQFVLRKDENSHWKILGWKAVAAGGLTPEDESGQGNEETGVAPDGTGADGGE